MNTTFQLDPAGTLRRHGLRASRRLGQNFLRDSAALKSIIDAADIDRTDVVLEIGCGLGGLTHELAQVAGRVVAIELDPRLAAIAEEYLRAFPNVTLVRGDALQLAPSKLDLPKGYVLAANIPYYITSPILRHILESEPRPRRLILTVQREVADRICARPPDMSLLAVSVQIYGTPRVVAAIPSEAFYPIPKVDSAVVRVDCHDAPLIAPAQLPDFFTVVKAGFAQPRKMLANSLAAALRLETSAARALVVDAAIDPRRRAETLSIDDWAKLTGVWERRTA